MKYIIVLGMILLLSMASMYKIDKSCDKIIQSIQQHEQQLCVH